MLKVLLVTSSYPRRKGDFAGHFLQQYAEALKTRGNEIEMIVPGDPGVPKEEVQRGITIHRFTYAYPSHLQKLAYGRGIPTNLKNSWIARMELLPFLFAFFLKILRHSRKFDILHAHWIPMGFPTLLAARATQKPFILTVHGSDLYPGGFLKPFYRYILLKANRVVCVSRALKEKVVEMVGDSRRILDVPNGVKFQNFESLRYEEEDELKEPILLWVGRMIEEKGLIILLKGMKNIVREFPKASLTLVGDGDLRNLLEEKTRSMGLMNHVHFAGEQPHHEIPRYLKASTLFILPSLKEGFGVVLLEAMSAEVAVVASRVGGISDIVLHERTGLLVPPEDSDALADAVILLLKNGIERKKMGREGRKRVLEHYTWEKVVQRMEEVYKSLLNG
jgi:glycosyltransferase involved in cell wall biosynthesis